MCLACGNVEWGINRTKWRYVWWWEKVRRGRMGSSVQQSTTNEPRITEKDIEAVAMALDRAEKIRNEARDTRRGLEREIRELTGILKEVKCPYTKDGSRIAIC